MITKAPTIANALEYAVAQLKPVEEMPSFVAELLLAHVLRKSRAYVKAWPEHSLDASQLSAYQSLIERRAHGEPVAYLTGSREFWSMQLTVTPDTLIPRPETERLVDLALERIPHNVTAHIADLGTGSGAIALALARERPRSYVTATDRSEGALRVAQNNATRLEINNVTFYVGDWCAALCGKIFDVIVSNPPYIAATDAHLQKGDLRFEPRSALTPGPDALRELRTIISSARECLRPKGWLLVEHGNEQQADVIELFAAANYTDVVGYRDFANQPRVVAGRRGA